MELEILNIGMCSSADILSKTIELLHSHFTKFNSLLALYGEKAHDDMATVIGECSELTKLVMTMKQSYAEFVARAIAFSNSELNLILLKYTFITIIVQLTIVHTELLNDSIANYNKRSSKQLIEITI